MSYQQAIKYIRVALLVCASATAAFGQQSPPPTPATQESATPETYVEVRRNVVELAATDANGQPASASAGQQTVTPAPQTPQTVQQVPAPPVTTTPQQPAPGAPSAPSPADTTSRAAFIATAGAVRAGDAGRDAASGHVAGTDGSIAAGRAPTGARERADRRARRCVDRGSGGRCRLRSESFAAARTRSRRCRDGRPATALPARSHRDGALATTRTSRSRARTCASRSSTWRARAASTTRASPRSTYYERTETPAASFLSGSDERRGHAVRFLQHLSFLRA